MNKIENKLQITDSVIPETYWDMTKSGKVLEFRVRPTIDQQPAKYRLGVIQIGRIISRIQSLVIDSDPSPQIQLFPNLAENQLVATVYCPELLEEIPQEIKKDFVHSAISVADIEQLASHYNLYTDKSASDQTVRNTEQILHIVSHSNQPFIWLKVGQFIQDLTDRLGSFKNRVAIAIKVDRTYKQERSSSERSNTYSQMTLTVPQEFNHGD